MVPFATSPCTPASRYAPTLRSSAPSSIAPEGPNGVVTAGMMPSKCAMSPSCRARAASHKAMGSATGRVRSAPRVQATDLGRRLRLAIAAAPVALGDGPLEGVEPARQRADRVGDRVGQVDPVGVGALGLAPVHPHDVAGV